MMHVNTDTSDGSESEATVFHALDLTATAGYQKHQEHSQEATATSEPPLPEEGQTKTGDEETKSTNNNSSDEPPKFDEAALYGPVGEIVRAILPHTESDAVAVYVQLLVGLGSLIGPSPYFIADGSQHRPNLFAVVCGRTAKARKGTSWQQARMVLEEVDEDWARRRVKSGTVSGEGITQVFEEGGDRRLLLVEGEFAQVLQVLKREGNTVSVLLRQAWDGQRIAVLRRTDPIEVEGAHLSMIGHITVPELHRLLAQVDMSNGLANRCLWLHADRSKLLPEGGGTPEYRSPLERIRTAVQSARVRNEVKRDRDATRLWANIYAELSEPPAGRLGDLLCRGEAQVMRLALLFALLDESKHIHCDHLNAALTLWQYIEACTKHIFADVCYSAKGQRLWNALQHRPLTFTDIHTLFSRNLRSGELEQLLKELAPRIEVQPTKNNGGEVLVRAR